MKKQLKGSLCLLLATVIWGSAFVGQSVGMDYIGPFTFQAVRCALAVIGLLPVIYLLDRKKQDGMNFFARWQDKRLWRAAFLCAIPLFCAINLQQIGIVYTDAGKSAFLTAMYIILVPIIGIFIGRKPSPMIPVSVLLAVVGLYLLSCVGVTEINIGDWYLLGCALMFAVQITFIDHFAPQVDPLRLNCLQSALCAIGSAIVMLFTEHVEAQNLLNCWFPLAYTGFLSMGAAYSMQIIGQRHLEPAAASLIMSLESVFAALSGWLFLHEIMTVWELSGCMLVFLAVILAQIPLPQKTS